MINEDTSKMDIRFAMCFPDVYETGMSHLGTQILYSMLNKRDDIYCERVYSPWMDLGPVLKKKHIPLSTLGTQKPVKNSSFLGITPQYEVCYIDMLQILDLSGTPLHTYGRTKESPIVAGGGPCAYSPEPLVDSFDILYIGEGETVYFDLMDRYKENKKAGGSRRRFLEPVAGIPGIYMPAFHDVICKGDGTTESFPPNNSHVTPVTIKQVVRNMDGVGHIETPPVPFVKVTQNQVMLEIQRGCIRDCRFCQVDDVYRPLRKHSLEYLKKYAWDMLKSTGNDEVSLSSLNSSDYSQLEGLVDFLIDEFKGKGINVSLPPLRIDAFLLDVMSKVQGIKESSLTFMPGTGSQCLRDVISKGLTEETILKDTKDASEAGWNRVKLYFMLGLPTKAVGDMEGIAFLSEKVAEEYHETPEDQGNGEVQIVASSSLFAPKPFAPFQWARIYTREEFIQRTNIVRGKFREMRSYKSLKYNRREAESTVLEGVLARGDHRVGAVIEKVYRAGAVYDFQSEHSNNDIQMKALETYNVNIGFYAIGERSLERVLPWDFISAGVTKEFLIREWNTAAKGQVALNCRQTCSGCGARYFGTSVCYETVRK